MGTKGTADVSLIRYISGLSNVLRQGKIFDIVPKKARATSAYTNKKTRQRVVPTNSTVEIYQYTAQQLKHLPSKSLDDIRETLLYEKSCCFKWW